MLIVKTTLFLYNKQELICMSGSPYCLPNFIFHGNKQAFHSIKKGGIPFFPVARGAAVWRPAVKRVAFAPARLCMAEAAQPEL